METIGHTPRTFAGMVYPDTAPTAADGEDVKRVHTLCAPQGTPVSVLDVPPFADPGRVVRVSDTGDYGRVRMLWRCCAHALVEFMTTPDDPECADTHTLSLPLARLTTPQPHVTYSVPCVGASWSLVLPCGHINGEGCDCDTSTAEDS